MNPETAATSETSAPATIREWTDVSVYDLFYFLLKALAAGLMLALIAGSIALVAALILHS